jgi:hypothetical protein
MNRATHCDCCGDEIGGFAAIIDGRAYCADCFEPPKRVPGDYGRQDLVMQHPMFPPEKPKQEDSNGTTNT